MPVLDAAVDPLASSAGAGQQPRRPLLVHAAHWLPAFPGQHGPGEEFRVWGLGFRVKGLGFGVWGEAELRLAVEVPREGSANGLGCLSFSLPPLPATGRRSITVADPKGALILRFGD